ncbi:LacI family transcriptional regulator [Egibacter rhizosphaerae]|uniref:LacI family transcriptional regulator n=1 Tax=Egibacter rhizosphaerae TaxID=1670831 RepID=A0A411YC02_9ACTN|nr:LacI family DNA-binding transcriptional regulator [Egibacter rhizosphaerae]QBI18761.1 LacI family transcriptional regulator [Egibacter rhizosphaerae]
MRGGNAGRRPTLRDIADAVGVSTALVSFALNDRAGVSAETKAQILAEASRLGYRTDPVARALRTGQSRLFGVVVRNLQNPYFLDVVGGMQEAAVAAGAGIVVADADYSANLEAHHVETFAAYRFDGLAVAPVGTGAAIAQWQDLRPDVPAVVLNASVPGLDDVARVSPDNATAVRLAVEHLAQLGHRRLGFLTAPAELMADYDRLEAFLALTAERDLESRPIETPLNLRAVHDLVGRALVGSEAPSAFITNSDFTAHAVYTAVRQQGLRVGHDVSVVGHDDLATSELLDPPLTTIQLDVRALGRAAFARLWGAGSSRTHLEPVRLVARGSTGPPPS